jgi:para-nitrobenzyl esterase
MKSAIVAAFAVAALAPAAFAQQPAAAPGDANAVKPVITYVTPKSTKPLVVTTPAFKTGDDYPFDNTQYRGNHFPGFAWTKGPAGTKSYVIIMQDPDILARGAAILHWTLFNIPASVTKLDASMTAPPAGASYGPNYKGASQPYLGPRTPPGPKHHYHIQVFALDTTIPDGAGASFDTLVAGLQGHVLADGELIGMGQADPTAPPPPPRPAPAAAQ